MLEKLKKLGREITDLLFPISCLICGKPNVYLCTPCSAKLPRQKQQCLSCQKPSAFGKTHANCLTKNTLDGFITSLPYSHPDIKKLIQVFKFDLVDSLAETLGNIMADEIERQGLQDYFQEFVLLPVPLHPRRLNWRGFNQAELLAQKISQRFSTIIDQSLLRIKNTKPQADLDRESRKTNIAGAFALAKEIAGKKFLLVDDVATTGATLSEIAKLLKSAHASEVWAITVAHG